MNKKYNEKYNEIVYEAYWDIAHIMKNEYGIDTDVTDGDIVGKRKIKEALH